MGYGERLHVGSSCQWHHCRMPATHAMVGWVPAVASLTLPPARPLLLPQVGLAQRQRRVSAGGMPRAPAASLAGLGAPALQLHAALCTSRPLGSPLFKHAHSHPLARPSRPSHGLFTPRVFAVKWAGSAAALGASLCLGLEAPMVHLGASVASLVSNADQRACWCVYAGVGVLVQCPSIRLTWSALMGGHVQGT